MNRSQAIRTIALTLLLALAACRGDAPATADPGLVADQGDADVVAAATDPTPTDPRIAPPGGGGGMPAPGAIRFDGFGPAAFGSNAEALRIAWGQDLGSADPAATQGCYFLYPQPRPDGPSRIAFMVDGDRFVRLDVAAQDIVAPGGGRVGMDAAAIDAVYPGRVERTPHEYVDGAAYLRVADAAGDGVLVFETDAAGTVMQWRVGLPPQVDYVEGCS